MNFELLLNNITNPTLLFFILGIVAVLVKSDLKIPESSSKFISLYLLFSIGFKGGQELHHSGINTEVIQTLAVSVAFAIVVPFYSFFLLRKKMGNENAGAIAATYGSVSAVTFVTATMFLEYVNVPFGGHMVASMALMESPAIIIGVLLMRRYSTDTQGSSLKGILHESLTNGSVFMIVGSLIIGIITPENQAQGIKPFTTDIFKGFLALYLLELGMLASRRFKGFLSYGRTATIFSILIPIFNGVAAVAISGAMGLGDGNRLLLAILASSASYIAVPAAMRQAAPNADPGLYIPMALGVTFPFNITIGMPIYWALIQMW